MSFAQEIRSLVQALLGRSGEESLKASLARGAAGSFALKIGSAGLSFIIGIVLARMLGTSGYGVYSYATAWVGLLTVPAALGFDKLLIREVAAYRTRGEWQPMKGIIALSGRLVLAASVCIAAGAAVIAWGLAGFAVTDYTRAFLVAMVLVPIVTITRLRLAVLRGFSRIIASQTPETLYQPALFVLFLGIVLASRRGCSAPEALALNIAASIAALIAGSIMLSKALPRQLGSSSAQYRTGIWMKSALPLMVFAGLQAVNSRADVIMLGSIAGPQATGVYSVANRVASLVSFLLVAVNTAIAPAVASLHAGGDREKLQKVITKSSRIILLFALPISLTLIFFGNFFLMLFGKGFVEGRTALTILCIGQIFSAAMGSVSLTLIMTGHESFAAANFGASALVNILLNLLLIPIWGVEGAAVSTTASVILRNVLSSIWLYKKLGIHATAFGPLHMRKKT